MSGASRGLPNVNYDFYHTFLTSIGTLLIFLSGGGIFAYIIGLYSFVRVGQCLGIILVIVPGLIGVYGLCVGLNAWKNRAEKQKEIAEEELRKQSADADIAEKEAEKLEQEANAAEAGKVTIGGKEYTIKEWEK
jgi:hypothetical protein